jgi:hypothetical protein
MRSRCSCGPRPRHYLADAQCFRRRRSLTRDDSRQKPHRGMVRCNRMVISLRREPAPNSLMARETP